jgi:DMSO/TMAO reductase YedYZ molybdopterin-dependent catalytic subunit
MAAGYCGNSHRIGDVGEGVIEQKRRNGLSGVVAAGFAVGVGELIAGLFRGVPSPLAAIGGVVVDSSPSFVKDFAIEVFGTADKTALAVGTTAIALVIGWYMGIQAARRSWIGPIVLGTFGLLGMLTSLGEPFAVPAQVVGATGVAVAGGWLLLDRLLAAAAHVPEPTDGLAEDASRRRFLGLVAGGSAAAIVGGTVGRRLLGRIPEVPEAASLAPARDVTAGLDAFDVPGLTPVVVPNDEFYRIDTALVVPVVDERDWTLRVFGDVEQEVTLGYEDLLGMEIVEDYVTIACVSNQVGGDLVGNALWSGVRLRDVLEMAGPSLEGTQLVGRSVDGFTAGFPTELAFDGREPLIALGMNGEPLPRRHGYPARLIVPGLYGYVSATKWLSEIEITGWDEFDGYWIPRGWAKEAPIKTQSRIDVPAGNGSVAAGPTVVAGVAWAPLRGVEGVEVRVDEGPWITAEVTDPASDRAWVQWRTTIDLAAGERLLEVRATDGSGDPQTDVRRPPRPDGATGYHRVRVRVA